MRLLLCVSLMFMFTTSAVAQFKNPPARGTGKSTESTERKTAEKGHPDRAAKAADQASAETDLANALLAIMDTDGDGVVTSIEYSKALKAINKVKKDNKGNRAYNKPADANATAAGGDPAQVGAAAAGGAAGRGNEATGRLMQYDTNHDGVLSPNEVPPQARAMLQGADLNGDGVIDARELQIFSRKMGEQMRALGAGAGPNGGAGVPGDGGGRKPPPNENN
jgi:EF hand